MQTVFRLPLRNSSHINAQSILNAARITPQHIRQKIVKPYYYSAKQALIFTKMESITTLSRDSAGNQTSEWAISASRDTAQSIFNFKTQLVHIHGATETEDFKVVSVSTPLSDLPSELTPLVGPHRMRSPIVVGLAAPLTPSNSNHNLFSVLPLPISTTLPVHLTGNFLLTPDRRHIRLDDYANAESKYNR
jgi:sacsin